MVSNPFVPTVACCGRYALQNKRTKKKTKAITPGATSSSIWLAQSIRHRRQKNECRGQPVVRRTPPPPQVPRTWVSATEDAASATEPPALPACVGCQKSRCCSGEAGIPRGKATRERLCFVFFLFLANLPPGMQRRNASQRDCAGRIGHAAVAREITQYRELRAS